jgi:predicted RNA polymerase sigma factor
MMRHTDSSPVAVMLDQQNRQWKRPQIQDELMKVARADSSRRPSSRSCGSAANARDLQPTLMRMANWLQAGWHSHLD